MCYFIDQKLFLLLDDLLWLGMGVGYGAAVCEGIMVYGGGFGRVG